MMTKINESFVALWRYDLYPYILSGHVTTLHQDGTASVKEYGEWYHHRYFALVPGENGEKVRKGLYALEHEYKEAKNKLLNEFLEKRNELLRSVHVDPESIKNVPSPGRAD